MINQYQLDRIWKDIREEVIDLADQYLDQGLAQGEAVNQDLEKMLCEHTGRKHATLVGNCTDALYIALKSLNLPQGFRAAVPDMTWISTASSVVRAGGIPVFFDIDTNYTINTEQDFSDCDVILAVDLLGNSCNWELLESKWAHKPIVHDAAQSFGTVYHSKSSLRRGTVACASFGPIKPLPSFGSGGALFTDDDELNQQHKLLRLHYKKTNLDVTAKDSRAVYSINSVMNSFEISAVTVGLKYYEAWRQRRNSIARYYYDNFKNDLEFSHGPNMPETFNALYKLAMRHKKQKSIVDGMHHNGVQAQGLYIPLTAESRFKEYPKRSTSVSSKFSFLSFTVPNQHTLTDSEVDVVVQELKKQL